MTWRRHRLAQSRCAVSHHLYTESIELDRCIVSVADNKGMVRIVMTTVVYNARRAVISVECASTVLRVQDHSTRNFGLSIKDFSMGRANIGQVGHLET